MEWQSILFSLLLAIIFLVIVSLYGYFSQRSLSFGGLVLSWNINDNLVATIILPPLLVLITAIVLVSNDRTWLLSDLWLVGLFIFLFRSLLIVLSKRLYSVKLTDWMSSGLLSVFLCYVVNRLVLYSEQSLRLSGANVSAALWSFGVISFLYLVYRVFPKNFTDLHTNRHFLGKLYADYYKIYGTLLNKEFKKDPVLQRIFFAILITEDLNRPRVFRFFERLAFPLGFIKTTGIMQVTSGSKLSDKKSVVLAQNLLGEYYASACEQYKSDYLRIKEIAYLYNDGDFYVDLIVYSYFTLTEIGAFNGAVPNI